MSRDNKKIEELAELMHQLKNPKKAIIYNDLTDTYHKVDVPSSLNFNDNIKQKKIKENKRKQIFNELTEKEYKKIKTLILETKFDRTELAERLGINPLDIPNLLTKVRQYEKESIKNKVKDAKSNKLKLNERDNNNNLER